MFPRLSVVIRYASRIAVLLGVWMFGTQVALAAGNLQHKDVDPQTVTIALIDTFDPDFYLQTYVPTIEYLKAHLPRYRFEIREVRYDHVLEDIDRIKPSFLVSSAGQFVTLINARGAQQIVTKKRLLAQDVNHSVASTFIVRADRKDLNDIADLKDKKVAATDREDFDGWQIALDAIARRGFDPDRFFSKTLFSHYQFPSVAAMVKNGIVDAGVLSTCQYEALIDSGAVAFDEMKVLNPSDETQYCVRSTELFPDVVFSYLPTVDATVVKNITMALLSMTTKSNDFEWMPASDFLETFELMKRLRIGPYAHLRNTTIEDFLAEHRQDIYFGLALVIAILIHIVRVNVLVRRRTEELKVAEKQRHIAEKEMLENRRRLDTLEKGRALSQMGALFAHEVKQPIANIVYYASGIRMLLRKLNIDNAMLDDALVKLSAQAHRTAEIVDHVRGYARHKPKDIQVHDLSEIASRAVKSLRADEHYGQALQVELMPKAWIRADAFELELVVLNLLKNAFSAVSDCSEPHVRMSVIETVKGWCLSVSDNGPKISDEVFQRLGAPVQSSKKDGLGIGLSIARDIVESHGGHLAFERLEPCGLRVSFVLAKDKEDESVG